MSPVKRVSATGFLDGAQGRIRGKALMYRTNSSRLNHVADGESLDGLVLGRASRAVAAADGVDVAAALLVAAVVLSL